MNNLLNSFTDATVQCWGCEVFDRLFDIVSSAAAAVYDQFVIICAIIFCIFMAFYLLNVVWANIKGGVTDPMYQKSLKPFLITSLISLAFLSMGVALPRFITTFTFEPVTNITVLYTQTMLHTTPEIVNERVPYEPHEISEDGFFRPQLRDSIILLMKTPITQFQSYIKLGIVIMDEAFSLKALLGVGALIKHIILFFIGAYLFYGFFKLFLRFCFYFADIIIAMTFFAFFFPFSLVLVAFKGESVPKWMSGLGKKLGTDQIKNLINSIVALAAAVMTYTIIINILMKFFSEPGQSSAELMTMVTQGNFFDLELSDENMQTMSLMSCVILLYVLNFLYDQIPNVTAMIMDTFGVSSENKLSETLANDAMKLSSDAFALVKNTVKSAIQDSDKNKQESKDKKESKDKDSDSEKK